MVEGKYSLRYIPRFEVDLNNIVDYLVFKLHNSDAAEKLINKIEKSITERLSCPCLSNHFSQLGKGRSVLPDLCR